MPDKKYDKFMRVIWRNEIKSLNDHLPKERKNFRDLIKDKSPEILTRSNDKLVVDKKELIKLNSVLDESEKISLKLPIVLIRRVDLGPGLYSISGGKIEVNVIKKLLSEVNLPNEMDYNHPYLYRPQVYELYKKYSTIIALGFGTGGLLTD